MDSRPMADEMNGLNAFGSVEALKVLEYPWAYFLYQIETVRALY